MEIVNRIAIITDNSSRSLEIILNAWKRNESVVLIDYRLPLEYIVSFFEENPITYCYVENGLINVNSLTNLTRVKIIEKGNCPILISRDQYISLFEERYDRNEAVVLFSSGTSGKNKGIRLSHYAINKNADAIRQYMKPEENDVFYLMKSITHSSTFVGEFLVAIKGGNSILFSPTVVSARLLVKNIIDYDVTIVGLNPILLKYFVMIGIKDIGKLRKIYCSGARISKEELGNAREKLKGMQIFNSYGLTEAGPRVCCQELSCHNNSVGKPIAGVSVKVLDKKGKSVENGKIGEIYVKTDSVFLGYLNEENYQDEWLPTKDIGYWDDRGELYVIGRIDDVMQINAHNIYPEVIEETICRNTNINECLVYKDVSDYSGKEQLLCLYVAPSLLRAKDIRNVLKDFLVDYEIPTCFYMVENIKYNENGKKIRNQRRYEYEKRN